MNETLSRTRMVEDAQRAAQHRRRRETAGGGRRRVARSLRAAADRLGGSGHTRYPEYELERAA